MRIRPLLTIPVVSVLTAAMTASGAVSPAVPRVATPVEPPGERDVIVQLFQWNWRSVGAECGDFLGPAGYGGVQVSPPQEHVVSAGHEWWQDYQPVSYQLTTRRGDRAAFAAMVDACHAAGVEVYVDAVVNHMAAENAPGPGSGGSAYSHYDYPGIYSDADFHHCGRNGNDDIVNYQDRWEVQHCELVNLADLATDAAYVQDRLAAYLNDLIALGVDGFRIDAAKHIPADQIGALKARLSEPVYLYQEVIDYGGEPIKAAEYVGNGDALTFPYGKDLGRIFRSERLAYLRTFGSTLPSESAVVFTDNHDTQRSGDPNVLTFRDDGRYAPANAFMLAWPYGTPKVMSSYSYGSSDEGPPSTVDGTTSDAACFDGHWVCEHRWRVIANLVGFHNVVDGSDVRLWWDNGNDLIAFGRGEAGYLVINDEDAAATGRRWQTALPAGVYCDVIHGDLVDGACTGPTYAVGSDGWFTADIAAHDGLALHVGARVG